MNEASLRELEQLPPVQNKLELLERIAPARLAIEATIAALPADGLKRAGSGGWSPKHHLSHLAMWERMIVAHLSDGTDAAVAGMAAQAYAAATLDEINARLHEMHKDDSLADVLRLFAEAHREILALLETLSDAELAIPYWPDDRRTVLDKIAGDTYLHYLEHRRWIRESISRRD